MVAEAIMAGEDAAPTMIVSAAKLALVVSAGKPAPAMTGPPAAHLGGTRETRSVPCLCSSIKPPASDECASDVMLKLVMLASRKPVYYVR